MKRPGVVLIVVALALLFAGSASFLVFRYLRAETGKPALGVAIVTAAMDIPIGTKLEPAHFKLATWPKEGVPSGCFYDANALPGRIAVRSISTGDIITEPKLMPQNAAITSGVMTYIVPQGHRAVTVAVNEVAGVAGFISPNNRVDVVLTSPLPGDKEDNNISKVIVQNVPVLATGQVTEQKDGKPTIVPTVTLDLVPDDAEKVIVGAKKGSLQLLLRNVIDVAAVTTSGATIPKAFNQGERPAVVKTVRRAVAKRAVKAAPPIQVTRYSVEVIKGAVKSTRDFPVDQ